MVIAASYEFTKKKKKEIRGEDYIHFGRTDILALQEDLGIKLNPKFIFSDIANLRSALLNHYDWSITPNYIIQEDLNKKSLVDFNIQLSAPMSFGVWWKKDLKDKKLIDSTIDFLKEIKL
jgi:DNA-binding transcriptional LysR family regulator